MSLAYKVEELLALRDSVSESAVSIDKFADEDVIKGSLLPFIPTPPHRPLFTFTSHRPMLHLSHFTVLLTLRNGGHRLCAALVGVYMRFYSLPPPSPPHLTFYTSTTTAIHPHPPSSCEAALLRTPRARSAAFFVGELARRSL